MLLHFYSLSPYIYISGSSFAGISVMFIKMDEMAFNLSACTAPHVSRTVARDQR
jgi:hypothetical protein